MYLVYFAKIHRLAIAYLLQSKSDFLIYFSEREEWLMYVCLVFPYCQNNT